MIRTAGILAAAAVLAGVAHAQMASRRPTVTATGRASVFSPPDQVRIDATVTVQAPTAQEATAQNAARMTGLLAALRKLLGASGEIRTTNLSVTPVYRTPQQGQPPVIVAYSASNSVEVTLSIVNMAGAVIDTATQNGATSVSGLRFGLKNPEPLYLQALRLATQQAKAHADVMAQAAGRVAGAILLVQESGASPILTRLEAAAATPVEPGNLEVAATVVVEAELN
jgi:hypothetical protein